MTSATESFEGGKKIIDCCGVATFKVQKQMTIFIAFQFIVRLPMSSFAAAFSAPRGLHRGIVDANTWTACFILLFSVSVPIKNQET